jgi:hypothetical protein
MANLQVRQSVRTGRTFIRISATPKSQKTRRLLSRFRKEVQAFEKRWKAAARAMQKAARARR